MNTALLALLNAQVAIVVGWAIREYRNANRYRSEARSLLGSIEDVNIAAWARLAGKKRPDELGLDADLARLVRRHRPVVTGVREQYQEAREGEETEFEAHPSIVQNGADSA